MRSIRSGDSVTCIDASPSHDPAAPVLDLDQTYRVLDVGGVCWQRAPGDMQDRPPDGLRLVEAPLPRNEAWRASRFVLA